jgi:ArsR family transcriptional regulator
MFDNIAMMTSIVIDVIDKSKYYGGDRLKYSHAEYVTGFKALSDETRLKIIDMLSCGEMCACDILEKFSISQSTLSYHMKTLVDSGFVNAVRDGAWMRYTLNTKKVSDVYSFLAEISSEKGDCICKKDGEKGCI